ncbi:MAG: response regulator [Synergistaceae bacterium]|nr:response regulator [Synergistaceae bacterium]
MLTYGFNVWIEASVLPFLAVMAAFLFLRYATNALVNRRFRILVLSTFLAALLEVASTLLVDGWGHRHVINLIVRTLYYATVNFNAYYLMRYVQAYVNVENRKFDAFNRLLIVSSVVVLVLNLMPGLSGFFFVISTEGGLSRGPYNTLWRSVYVIYFVAMALWLQITHKQYYTEKSQFIVLNFLVALLIFANVVQYLFIRTVLFSYAVACVVLFVTFFYYEAPTYRRMNTVEKELEDARVMVEKSTYIINAANKAKSDFLANTSHEVRTPMNAILGMNEMILKDSKDPEIRQAALNIRKAGTHLLSIINNILDISKIESGKMELYKTNYHLWQLLRDIEESHYDAIHEKGLEFVIDVDKTIPEYIYGDEDRIRQIINNLIDNAAKYTSKGRIIFSVKGTVQPHSRLKLVISVEDTGIGIKQEDMDKLFISFSRVNMRETQSIQGAGLGLTLVRYLVELMNGSISVQSEYGIGSKFSVELPQLLAQEGFQGSIKEYEEMLEREHENFYGNPSAKEDDDRPFTCPDASILVVDDTPVNLVVARGMLKETKARVDTVESGEECLEMLQKNHYDLVFLDHKMPGMDGIQTLNAAREIESSSRLAKYIALTANSGAGLRDEYISLGFNDYLPKPIKLDAMRKILAKYLPENLKKR